MNVSNKYKEIIYSSLCFYLLLTIWGFGFTFVISVPILCNIVANSKEISDLVFLYKCMFLTLILATISC